MALYNHVPFRDEQRSLTLLDQTYFPTELKIRLAPIT